MSGKSEPGDSKGYEKGAKGIDGKKGEGFDKEGNSKEANEKSFGRCWER